MATPRTPKSKVPAEPKVLVGKGRQGDFVRQGQTMGTDAGFRNVSQKWLDKGCLSYDEVGRKIQEGRVEIEDFRIPFKAMTPTINDANEFVMRHEGLEFKPTPFALEHIAGWAGVSVFDVQMLSGQRPDSTGRDRNRPQDRQALLTLLNTGFSLIDKEKDFLFRTQRDGTLRAWLSQQYQIMDNAWFVDVLKDIIPGGVFSHWREDGDYSTLWGNVLIPDTIRQETDSEYGAMFSVGNSEIGRRNLHATPSLFRAICMNGCIWDRTRGSTFRQIHRGKIDLLVLRNQLRKHLTDQIPLINNSIDDLLSTRTIGWDGASAMPVFAALGQQFRLSKACNTEIMTAWREQANEESAFANDDHLRRSGFAVINAVTRSANNVKSPDEWVKRDEVGGRLLGWHKNDWSHLFSHAKTMKSEDVVAAFSTSHT